LRRVHKAGREPAEYLHTLPAQHPCFFLGVLRLLESFGEAHDLLDHHLVLLLEPRYVALKRVHRGVGLLQGAFGTPAYFVRSPQVCLQVLDLALEVLAPLLVHLHGGVGLGTEVRAARLEILGAPPLKLLL
jgi:hypothetical protein